VSGIFYGVSVAVIALILHSSYRLAKLGIEDRLQWLIAAACLAVTVALQDEVALVFIIAGLIGMLFYGNLFKQGKGPPATLFIAAPATLPFIAAIQPVANSRTVLLQLLGFSSKQALLPSAADL
jgi:chromate transporter